MPAPANLIHETSTTTGTGNLTVAAVNGKVRFSDSTYGFGTGGTDAFWYFISNQSAAEWEIGTGHMSDANTLVRDTILFSSNSNNAVNFSAGTKDVTNDVPAANQLRTEGGQTLTGTLTLPNTGLHLLDTNASHDLIIAPGSNLTADHTLTITTGDADRTLTLNGDITPMGQGKHTISIPASAMISRTTNGAASVTTELATNDVMLATKDFDQTTSEGVQFHIPMPKGWDEGTVTFIPYWTAAAGTATQTVIWTMAGLARSDDDPLDTAFGTAQSSSDALIATNDLHIGPESSAITIGGTPAENDLVIFQVTRDISDTLAADAKLIGVKVLFTTNAATDA